MNNPFKDQNRFGLAIILGLILFMSIACLQAYSVWQSTITIPPQDVGKDYIGQVIQAFTGDPIALLFGETQGSAPLLKFFSLGLIWIWASYLIPRLYERSRHITDRFYWSSFAWCLYATVFIMVAWIFGAAAQHFGWYACYFHCYPGEEGTMDKVTHIFSPGAIAAIMVTVNLQDLLKLRGRTGRILELAAFFLIMVWIIISFENIETRNASVYVNVLWNSVTDIAAGLLAVSFQFSFYNLVVPYEE